MHPLINKAKEERRHPLEPEVLEILNSYSISVPPYKVIHNESEALRAAKSLGWPVVMKTVSQDILHKTESGAVILEIQNDRQVCGALSKLSSLESPSTKIDGYILYPFKEHDLELSVGMIRDAQFGPVITFGLGGIWIEILKDIVYCIAPLSNEEALEMMDSIKASNILKGFRTKRPVDRKSFADLLVRLSQMAMEEAAIQEMDLNPIFPTEEGYFIADARIIL